MGDETESVSDQTNPTGDDDSSTPYISPDVVAAREGLRVQMGKKLAETEERTETE